VNKVPWGKVEKASGWVEIFRKFFSVKQLVSQTFATILYVDTVYRNIYSWVKILWINVPFVSWISDLLYIASLFNTFEKRIEINKKLYVVYSKPRDLGSSRL